MGKFLLGVVAGFALAYLIGWLQLKKLKAQMDGNNSSSTNP